MSAPLITSAQADQIVEIAKGTRTFEVSAQCRADPAPTAELWINLGWPFYSGNVRKVYALPVEENGEGEFRAKHDVYAPSAWVLPDTNSAKRWIKFTNADGSADSGKVQVRTIAA